MKRTTILLLFLANILLASCSAVSTTEEPKIEIADLHRVDARIKHFQSANFHEAGEFDCGEPHKLPWESSYAVSIMIDGTNQIIIGDFQEDGSVLIALSPYDFLNETQKVMFGDWRLHPNETLVITLKNGESSYTSITNCGWGYVQTLGGQ